MGAARYISSSLAQDPIFGFGLVKSLSQYGLAESAGCVTRMSTLDLFQEHVDLKDLEGA